MRDGYTAPNPPTDTGKLEEELRAGHWAHPYDLTPFYVPASELELRAADLLTSKDEENRILKGALLLVKVERNKLASAIQSAETLTLTLRRALGPLLSDVQPYRYGRSLVDDAKLEAVRQALSSPGLGDPMKMLVDADWLRKHIETDPDIDVEAGAPGLVGEVQGAAQGSCLDCGTRIEPERPNEALCKFCSERRNPHSPNPGT